MQPDFLQSVLIDAARERSSNGTLERLVSGMAAEPAVALARIWLARPGDICDGCALRPQCADQSRCLHLVASAGTSQTGANLGRLDGDFRRFPFGVRKVGVVAATGQGNLIRDVMTDEMWIARPEWVRAEGIHSFAGHPLSFNDEVLGVLAIFTRAPITDEDFRWIRVFADHAAAEIANANAYDEIRQLHAQLEQENEYLREAVSEALDFGEIIGVSPALLKVLQQVELVAPTDANVLVQGESGTGKELVARSIHERSRRSHHPMITVNCASIPKELFESEFFGHVKGSFTGAVKDRVGRFELADGGTLFLDEVGEIPLELQSKLLRVLQEGEFERVGDARARKVDVRVISATNRNLLQEVEAGQFRQDLFYRLSVFPVDIPPLRERPEDIAPLAQHFLRTVAKKHGVPALRFTRRQLEEFRAHNWPGNVRELQHVLERAVILAAGGKFDPGSLLPGRADTAPHSPRPSSDANDDVIPFDRLKALERRSIEAALREAGGKVYGKDGAAALLCTKPTTLASRIKALGIERRQHA